MDFALNVMMYELIPKKPCCFIDVDSFNSLGEITRAMYDANASKNHMFFLLTGKNICSEVLSDMSAFRLNNPFSAKESFREFLRNIKIYQGKTYTEVITRINSCRNLSMLTLREQQQFRLFAKYQSLKPISDLLNLSLKTLYSRERTIARKLGLSGSVRLRYFIQTQEERFLF
ncbi:TPA: hypothetical protein ACH1J3_004850 [Citrobacter werkmanii]